MLKKFITNIHALIDLLYEQYNHSLWAKIFYPLLLRQRAILGTVLYKSPLCPTPASPTRWIASLLDRGAIFIDGGGHSGLMSMIASVCVGNEGQVHTFEPQSQLVERLNLELSAGKFSNVTLNQKLLAESSGTLVFFQIPEATVSSSVSPLLSSRADVVQVECPATSLDDYWNSLKKPRPVDLIKLDVEGYEFAVIRGCKTLIQSYYPLLILEVAYAERWPESFGYSLEEMLTYLSELGYKSYEPQGFIFTPITTTSNICNENLFFIHEKSRLYEKAMKFVQGK